MRRFLPVWLAAAALAAGQNMEMGRLAGGEKVVAFAAPSGGWNLAVEAGGKVFATLANPVSLEFYNDGWPAAPLSSGYQTFTAAAGRSRGQGHGKDRRGSGVQRRGYLDA